MAQITLNSTGVASSGALVLQSNGTTTAVTVSTGQVATLVNDAVVNGLTVGRGAGAVATNTAVGASALAANQAGGTNNTAIGNAALDANTTGDANTAVGDDALGANTTASNNTAVGYQAGYTNSTGTNNTIVGYQAGYSVTGTSNTLIGVSAGAGSVALTTGSNCTLIGLNASPSASSDTGEIVICTTTATGKGSNTGFITPNSGGVYQGNNSSSWSTTSDQRLKKNIVDNTDGLSKIASIRVRNFEYRLPEEITELDSSCAVANTGVQLGVIAQELQQVLPECVKTESTGVMSVNSDKLTWYLVNAIKELKAEIDALKGA